MLKTFIKTSNSNCFADTLTKIYFQVGISAVYMKTYTVGRTCRWETYTHRGTTFRTLKM